MKLFKFFHKQENSVARAQIDKLYEEKNYDEIIARVSSWTAEGKNVPSDVKQKLALSYYYKRDYAQSLKYFQEIAAEKENRENLFNVLMSALALKQTEYSGEIFNKLLNLRDRTDKNSPRELGIPYIRFYYARGLYEAKLYAEAMEQIEELKKIYLCLKITDDTFLYIRGVPFLTQTLELAKNIFDARGLDFSHSSYLIELKQGVDEEGKNTICKYETAK